MRIVDAVVIGAGHNGLVAANLLADAGWSVLVLEATAEPGGAVRTAELTAPGFQTDLCSAFYPMAPASPVFKALRLSDHGLRWRHAPDVLAHVLPDDEAVVLSRDVERTATSVGRFAAGDADAWRDEVALWERIGGQLLNSLLHPFPPVRGATSLLRAVDTAEAIRLLRRFLLPVRRFGEETFDGDGARLLIAGNAVHSVLGPDDAASALFGWLLTMLGQTVGYPVAEGGAGRITDALVARLADRGGTVECGRTVTGILVRDGRAVGVRDADGEQVHATRAVLADVPAPTLYRRLLGEEHLSPRMVDDLKRFQWDDGTVKIDWALSGPIPWSNPAFAGAGTVHLGVDINGMATYNTQLRNGVVPDDPLLLLGQMTTADPTRSPRGTESVWAYTHVPRDLDWTADRAQRFADRIETVIARHAPDFTSRVIGRAIQTPVDLEEHNPSLVGGALNQGTTAIHQQLIFRPTPGLGRADTPVDRLFLAGASAHPGGAVHGAPGANAARAALARSGVLGGLYRMTTKSLLKAITR